MSHTEVNHTVYPVQGGTQLSHADFDHPIYPVQGDKAITNTHTEFGCPILQGHSICYDNVLLDEQQQVHGDVDEQNANTGCWRPISSQTGRQ